MTVAQAAPHTAGVVTHITAAGLLVGRGQAPEGGGWQGAAGESAFTGYVVVYPFPGTPEGTLADRHRDLLYTFQITAVGASDEQAEVMADLARTRLLDSTPTVAGRVVQPLWQFVDEPVRRDDAINPPLWYMVTQYRMRTEHA